VNDDVDFAEGAAADAVLDRVLLQLVRPMARLCAAAVWSLQAVAAGRRRLPLLTAVTSSGSLLHGACSLASLESVFTRPLAPGLLLCRTGTCMGCGRYDKAREGGL
jgi:CHASE2 domain-containing sensor protein